MKHYLLTIQLQQPDGKTFLSNEIIDIKPEVWLSKKIRDVHEGTNENIIVITNCIELEDANLVAVQKIGSSDLEIKLPNIGF